MADATPKKTPQLFTTGLFPDSANDPFGGDLLGSSPFMLAPAAPSGSSGTQRTSSQQSLARSKSSSPPPPSNASPQQERRSQGNVQPLAQAKSASPPPRDSPQLDTKNPTNGATSSKNELITVPLDSPIHSVSVGHWQRPPPSSVAGWNDPPIFQKSARSSISGPGGNEPSFEGGGATQSLSGQQFDTPQRPPPSLSPAFPPLGPPSAETPQPPVGSGPPPTTAQGAANPYRLAGAGKKAQHSTAPSFPAATSQPFVPPPRAPPPMAGAPPSLTGAPPLAVSKGPSMQPPPPYTPAAATATRQPPLQSVHQSQQADMAPGHTGFGMGSEPVRPHWFYLRPEERYWFPFSLSDSARLEEALLSQGQGANNEVIIRTDGGRYDVDLHRRVRRAIYWAEPPSQVKRCSWFYKGESDRWYLPYEEDIAAKLEVEFLSALTSNIWNRRIELAGGNYIVMHSRSAIVQYAPVVQFQPIDHEKENGHPKVVLRGFMEVDKVEQGEQLRIDHLVLVVHGVGSIHEAGFKTLVNCVDDFREVAQLMLKTHQFERQAPQDGDGGGRIEFLPVHWHGPLNGDDATVEGQVKTITLGSGSRLRDFTNGTLLDFLFYTSPAYYEDILNEVAKELNQLLAQFKLRNPSFRGTVSVMGHSLGSCILFDLLRHQGDAVVPSQPSTDRHRSPEPDNSIAAEMTCPETTLESALESLGLLEYVENFRREKVDFESLLMLQSEDFKDLGIPMGPKKKLLEYVEKEKASRSQLKEQKSVVAAKQLAKEKEALRAKEELEADIRAGFDRVKFVHGTPGIGQPFAQCTKIDFAPRHFFAIGSPVGFFLGIRGVDILGPDFKLPTCPNVFNIFHPYDPMAYRVEPLLVDSCPKKPLLMPHHKGRKRFHLELYENLGQVGASIKYHLVEGARNVWNQLSEIARGHTTTEQQQHQSVDSPTAQEIQHYPEPEFMADLDVLTCQLNQGRRIDHVLQEKPIESLNEYLFAFGSHLCYWRSEDTALFLLKEIYNEPNPKLIKM